jgi:hypothetical protein
LHVYADATATPANVLIDSEDKDAFLGFNSDLNLDAAYSVGVNATRSEFQIKAGADFIAVNPALSINADGYVKLEQIADYMVIVASLTGGSGAADNVQPLASGVPDDLRFGSDTYLGGKVTNPAVWTGSRYIAPVKGIYRMTALITISGPPAANALGITVAAHLCGTRAEKLYTCTPGGNPCHAPNYLSFSFNTFCDIRDEMFLTMAHDESGGYFLAGPTTDEPQSTMSIEILTPIFD